MDNYIIPVSYLQTNEVISEAKIQNALEFLLFFVVVSIIICTWIAKSVLPGANSANESQNIVDNENRD